MGLPSLKIAKARRSGWWSTYCCLQRRREADKHTALLADAYQKYFYTHILQYRFLVDHASTEHIYYRWKLFSILQVWCSAGIAGPFQPKLCYKPWPRKLYFKADHTVSCATPFIHQGEDASEWSLKPFRMFIGGPMWEPPPVPDVREGVEKGHLAVR